MPIYVCLSGISGEMTHPRQINFFEDQITVNKNLISPSHHLAMDVVNLLDCITADPSPSKVHIRSNRNAVFLLDVGDVTSFLIGGDG